MDEDLIKRYEERMRQFAGHEEHFLVPCEEEFGLWERTKYVGGSALAVGGVAGFIGFGGYSLLLAAAAGAMGYVWSEELRRFVLDHAPAPKAARRSRHSRLHWWLTGEVPQEPEQEAEDETEDDEEDNDQEGTPLRPQQPQQRPPVAARPSQRSEPSPDFVQLAPDLALPIDEIAGKAIFVAGIRRSGKTTLGVRIGEELGGHYIPLFIPDLEGDCLSMVDILPRGKVAGSPDSSDPQSTYANVFEPVTVDNAFVLGYTILEVGWQVVLDMASYPSIEEACQVIVGVIRGLFAWADEHPRQRTLCHVYLDEAQRFLPERLSDSIIQEKATLDALLKAYMDILAVGGKRGIAPVILTQRFAQVNKKIMAQTEIFFLMRQTMDNDLSRCMEYVKKSTATEEEISRFQQGQGVYIGADGQQFVTRFHQRHSDGQRSHTPRAEAARRYAQMPLSRLGAGRQQASEAPQEAPRQDPGEQRQPAAQAPTSKAPRLAPELQKALDAWSPGISYRDLGRAMGCGKDKAGDLIEELRQRGLIPSKEEELALLLQRDQDEDGHE